MTRAVLVFLKLPVVGKVKTRLAAGIGGEAALWAYCQMVAKVLECCRESGVDWIAIAFDPAGEMKRVQSWIQPYLEAFVGEVLWIPQVEGDLGQRLDAASRALFEQHEALMLSVIGTDCVDLDRALFDEAARRLEGGDDVVYGPTEDGGYYLLATKAWQPALFQQVRWSTEFTLEDSLTAAESSGLKVSQLPPRLDVDTESEWARVRDGLSDRKAVFFDRDGVVNVSPGAGYVLRAEDFHLNEGIPDILKALKQRGFLLILITSQKGVGKGLMTQAALDEIHRKMQCELARSGAAFDGIYAYTGEDSCRHLPKPDPEMILSAAESFFIDRRQSWMIGDADRDIEMGRRADLAGTIRVEGEKPIGIEADYTVSCLSEIANLIEIL